MLCIFARLNEFGAEVSNFIIQRNWRGLICVVLFLPFLTGCWEWYAINAGLQVAQLIVPPAIDAAKDMYNAYVVSEKSEPVIAKPFSSPDPVDFERDPPIIVLSSSGNVDSDEYILTGVIEDTSNIATLQVGRKTVPFETDGSFAVPFYIPPGGLEIEIVAIDEWNNRSRKAIRIARNLDVRLKPVSFEPPNPMNADGSPNPDAVALIIGLERYQNTPSAKYADRDAQVFSDFARRALGVKPENIKLLVNNQATRTGIQKALKLWVPAIMKRDKSDVFIFFAGHGLASANGFERYLLPYDADTALLDDSALVLEDIITTVSENRPRSAVFFLDTCYSGGTRTGQTLVANARGIRIVAKASNLPTNFTVISAAGNDQVSTILPEAKHGLFSYYLMKGMEGGAGLDAGRRITTQELYEYVAGNVPKQAIRLGKDQRPQIYGELEMRVVSK
jgi:hypothetical protein